MGDHNSVSSHESFVALPGHESFIGSIDQGTTSTRFLIFNKDGEPVASHQVEFSQIYPQSGFVLSRSQAARYADLRKVARAWSSWDYRLDWGMHRGCCKTIWRTRSLGPADQSRRAHESTRNNSCLGPRNRRASSKCYCLDRYQKPSPSQKIESSTWIQSTATSLWSSLIDISFSW